MKFQISKWFVCSTNKFVENTLTKNILVSFYFKKFFWKLLVVNLLIFIINDYIDTYVCANKKDERKGRVKLVSE